MTYEELCLIAPTHKLCAEIGDLWNKYYDPAYIGRKGLSIRQYDDFISDRIARELALGEYTDIFKRYNPESLEDALEAQEAYRKAQEEAKIRS